MAVTGLALCLFLVGHLVGNLLLLFPANEFLWFNTYSNTLNAIPILLLIELGLLAIFLLHAYEGFMVWRQSKAARPIDYQGGRTWTRTKNDKSKKTLSSTMMMTTGIIILIFVALHVFQMKYRNPIGPSSPVASLSATSTDALPGVQSPQESKSLSEFVIYEFHKPYIAILYMLCMVALGLHLYHAVWSSFQTLGATETKSRKAMIFLGSAFSIVIAGGFFMLPLYVWFFTEVTR